MPTPLTFSPMLAERILRGTKTVTRRPVQAFHRLCANPVRVVSVKTRSVDENPPVLWEVGKSNGVKFSRNGPLVYYRFDGSLLEWLEPSSEWKAYMETKGIFRPDMWIKSAGYQPMRVMVNSLWRQPLNAIVDSDIEREGFSSYAEFRYYWETLHGGWIDKVCLDGQVWGISIAPEQGLRGDPTA